MSASNPSAPRHGEGPSTAGMLPTGGLLSGGSLPAASFALVVWTLAERELKRFFRQRSRVIGAVGQPVLFWLLFGAGLHGSFKPPAWGPELSYQEYFFPGVVVLIVLFTAIFSTISVIEDRREGFLQGVLVAPVSRTAIVFGKLTGGMLLALLQAGIFVCLAPLAGIPLSVGSFLAIGLYLILLGYVLTALGLVIAWPLDSTQGFHAIMSVVLLPMWLLSGSFFPAEGAGWLTTIIRLNPMTYAVAGLRRLLYAGQAIPVTMDFPAFGTCLLVLLASGAVLVAVSVRQAGRHSSADAR